MLGKSAKLYFSNAPMLRINCGGYNMYKYHVPDDRQAKIITENGLNPKEYAVISAEKNCLHLLCYKTRDQVIIRKGDRAWS